MKKLNSYKAGKKACLLIKQKEKRVKVEEVVYQGMSSSGNAIFDPLLEGDRLELIKHKTDKEFFSQKKYDIKGYDDLEAVIFITEDCFKKYCMKVIGV